MPKYTKVFKLTTSEAEEGNRVSFHPDIYDARATRDLFLAKHPETCSLDDTDIETIVVELTKRGVMELLKHHAPEMDNG